VEQLLFVAVAEVLRVAVAVGLKVVGSSQGTPRSRCYQVVELAVSWRSWRMICGGERRNYCASYPLSWSQTYDGVFLGTKSPGRCQSFLSRRLEP